STARGNQRRPGRCGSAWPRWRRATTTRRRSTPPALASPGSPDRRATAHVAEVLAPRRSVARPRRHVSGRRGPDRLRRPPASAPSAAVPGTAHAPYLSRGDQVEARYDAYRVRLERFFEALRTVTEAEAPDLRARIEPPAPVPYGYQILPKV